ncbi:MULTISPECIES: FUSC family protein [unclassified Streptomyces]|uniref:FUSC family protein n=1 Tax=unclassified Streptomyces TaxID=2593676 RepID=UPI00225B7A19|nr:MULTISPECIES: FUSC family protein [unclassified Streptomyces]MCX4524200.1 FUSC family protein [Streptomyces sp. NBC_01551]MCX4545281.1 FUSC family protein [Streptomyces sp. NBC_01565]
MGADPDGSGSGNGDGGHGDDRSGLPVLRALRGPGPKALAARRAVRTTLAACIGFYLCLYGLDRSTAATYALFGAVSMATLSHIPGTGRQRAAVMAWTLPVAWVLVTAGTYLAVRTWSAVVGVLVIGFALAFVAAAGPRAAGASPGLQLMYILPCFPPYAPDTLGDRLAGATLGIGLLILAETFVLPERRGTTYAQLVARASDTAARCAAELGRPPYILFDASAEAVKAAGESLRPSLVAEAERPAGPGLRERALAHGGLAARTLLNRLAWLAPPAPGHLPGEDGPDLLAAVGLAVTETSAKLSATAHASAHTTAHTTAHATERGARATARAGAGTEAADALRRARRQAAAADSLPSTGPVLRRRAALLEVADATVALATAADLAVRGRAAAPALTEPGRFWYARQNDVQLWLHRLAGHAGPRSVYFQNAVRISLALAAARTVAGLDSLPHGFWAMLAALTLTRTTVAQTGATVRQALTGTVLGALAAGAVLASVGGETTVYAVALPIVMLVAFTVGPVRGVGWAQGMFTLVVSLVFAQLAPATWRLAEVRILDVLIGSLIGVVFGLLAWPRGAQRELSRSVSVLLSSAAATVEDTTAYVRAGRPAKAPDDEPLLHALTMAESAFAQFQSEPREHEGPVTDWQVVLMTGHHVLWGSRRLLGRTGPAFDPQADAWAHAYATGVANGLRRAAGTPESAAAPDPCPDPAAPRIAPPLFFATATWLDALTADLARMAAAGSALPGHRRRALPDGA